jgi:hypothetical protein
MKLEFYQQILEESLNINFNQNPSSGSRVVPFEEQTDITNLVIAFRNFRTRLIKQFCLKNKMTYYNFHVYICKLF